MESGWVMARWLIVRAGGAARREAEMWVDPALFLPAGGDHIQQTTAGPFVRRKLVAGWRCLGYPQVPTLLWEEAIGSKCR